MLHFDRTGHFALLAAELITLMYMILTLVKTIIPVPANIYDFYGNAITLLLQISIAK